MSQDQSIADFKQAVSDQLTAIGAALDNISADEATLLQKITDLQNSAGELTPANQQTLTDIVTSLTGMAAHSKTVADAVPDTPPPAPPSA